MHRIGDNALVVGDDLYEGFTTPQPYPTQADLDVVVAPADKVLVNSVHTGKFLTISDDPGDLGALRAGLRISLDEMGHCMCSGDIAFAFFAGREELGTVTLHHGESLRWKPFFNNAPLADPWPLLDWLDAHGIKGMRKEVERNRSASAAHAERRWRYAMPAVLRPYWRSMARGGRTWPKLEELLVAEYPDPAKRARVLIHWFGRGAGPWSGYPPYESVPEWCLLRMPLDALLAATLKEPISRGHLEGAARFFSGEAFTEERGAELAELPPELKARLLEWATFSGSHEKRTRAAAAFGHP